MSLLQDKPPTIHFVLVLNNSLMKSGQPLSLEGFQYKENADGLFGVVSIRFRARKRKSQVPHLARFYLFDFY